MVVQDDDGAFVDGVEMEAGEIGLALEQPRSQAQEEELFVVEERYIPQGLLHGAVVEKYEGEQRESCDGADTMIYHGKGKAWFRGGNTYQGDFKNGKMHGQGRYTWVLEKKVVITYEGMFAENKLHGNGKLTWENGSWYEGAFRSNARHGWGKFFLSGCNVEYEGQWALGKRHGKGRLVYSKSPLSVYEGSWVQGKRQGHGKMTYPNGNVYDGEWSEDVKQGRGTMYWNTLGERYCGEWKADKQHGQGQHVWQSEETKATINISQMQRCNQYEGEWMAGQRHGFGTFLYADGSKYEGDWVCNTKHGHGVFVFSHGRVYRGKFEHDKMVDQEQICGHQISPLLIDLSIDDIMSKVGVEGRREKREVENLLLRWNAELRTLYLKCANAKTQSPAQDSAHGSKLDYSMTLDQFQALSRKCKFPDETIAVSHVNRILHEVVTSKHNSKLDHGEEIHANNRTILYREFIETLVRVAHLKYGLNSELSTTAMRLSRLLNCNLKQVMEEQSTPRVDPKVEQSVMQAFAACATKPNHALFETDKVATPRNIIKRLQMNGYISAKGFGIPIQRQVETRASTQETRDKDTEHIEGNEEIRDEDQNGIEVETVEIPLKLSIREAIDSILSTCPIETASEPHDFEIDNLDYELLPLEFDKAIRAVAEQIRANLENLAIDDIDHDMVYNTVMRSLRLP